MKVIGFNGSPRKNGNTGTLVDEMLKGAADNGAETKSFYLNNMNIKGCQGCFYCKSHELCAIKDDMDEIYKEFKDADAVIIGSPIYMLQMSAQAKLFLDRLYAMVGRDSNDKFIGKFGEKKGIFVYTQGQPDENIFKQYFAMNNRIVKIFGLNAEEPLIATGTEEKDDSKKNEELMRRAYEIGKKLAI